MTSLVASRPACVAKRLEGSGGRSGGHFFNRLNRSARQGPHPRLAFERPRLVALSSGPVVATSGPGIASPSATAQPRGSALTGVQRVTKQEGSGLGRSKIRSM